MMMMLANNYTMVEDIVRGTSCQDFVQQAYIHIDYLALTASHRRGNNPGHRKNINKTFSSSFYSLPLGTRKVFYFMLDNIIPA